MSSIRLIEPYTPKCKKWINENVEFEDWQRYGDAVAMDRRYFDSLFYELEQAGFRFKKDFGAF